MADIKHKVEEAGHKIAETATKVGHKISEGAEKAADWVKEKAHEVGHRVEETAQKVAPAAKHSGGHAANIRQHMEVIASCGTRIGKVDHLEGSTVKLTRDDPQAGGRHHFIPLSWVQRVDQHVHLNKNSEDAMRDWKSETVGTTG